LDRDEDVGKRRGGVANVGRFVKKTQDAADVGVDFGWVLVFFVGVYGGVVGFVVNEKEGFGADGWSKIGCHF
jgi:hypothetical protein